MKILVCFGTRPEWIKIKPLIDSFKKNDITYDILFTGQHTDLLKNIEVDHNLILKDLSSNRLNSILANNLLSDVENNYTHVLVQGDTTSALGMALWGFHNKLKIIHLEAGLRTHDLNHPFPEEANRQLISRITDIHFCATEENKKSLYSENVPKKDHIYVVGNTGLDNLVNIKPSYTNKVLVTLHRRENHDLIEDWFKSIDILAKQYNDLEFILPIHPNPEVVKHKKILQYTKVVDPMDHNDTINILKDCKFVITDSGGIQEEASFFNKKIIICRKTTERSECLGTHGVLCLLPCDLQDHVNQINFNYKIENKCPFGDGYSSMKITNILKNI
jgi:UDP-N-acetylglucosamine 2-epimerase (non-hydrolysing)